MAADHYKPRFGFIVCMKKSSLISLLIRDAFLLRPLVTSQLSLHVLELREQGNMEEDPSDLTPDLLRSS